jgi:hypothetical protein
MGLAGQKDVVRKALSEGEMRECHNDFVLPVSGSLKEAERAGR